MAKPVIMIVDDEVQVLNAVERDLRQHFKGEYRIVKASGGRAALEAVQQLKKRNAPLALFLVDQRMPDMTGTEFLKAGLNFYPQAAKVLLTAYADTEAAITSINQVGLDYYLMKPWEPPEQNLYPVLDDLLSDWQSNVGAPFEGIRVAGTQWSASSHAVKDFLTRNQVSYQWLDIEKDSEARALVEAVNQGGHRLPVIFFPDGEPLVDPSPLQLAERVGLRTQAASPFYDFIIIGAGPAGLAAAVYAGSEGLKTVIIEKEAAGGQAGTSARIENYLGFPRGLSGADLSRRATSQARRFGVEMLTAQEVLKVRVADPYRYVQLSDGCELSCHALLLATGVSVRKLPAPGIDALTGAGVYYGAAMTEAAQVRGQEVFVVGGANSAGQGAVFLSRFASKVTMLVRSSDLEVGMSQYLIDQIRAIPNIQVLFRKEVVGVRGAERLEEIEFKDVDSGVQASLPGVAMFIFIGAAPHTDLVADLVARDSAGFIITGPDLLVDGKRPKGWTLKRDPYLLETSVPGIFAAGDVRHHSVKRVASAVGEGSVVVSLVHQYLKTV
jgi:thioredoxin reductase (NADPH)